MIAVVGAGPAGLMAAEVLARGGLPRVTVLDHMPSPARKLLIAGRGGLNLTHSEPLDAFLDRYGEARAFLEPAIRRFPPAELVAWCEGVRANAVHFTSWIALVKSMRVIGCGARGRSG
jgi:predicted flavoprotein YhiN